MEVKSTKLFTTSVSDNSLTDHFFLSKCLHTRKPLLFFLNFIVFGICLYVLRKNQLIQVCFRENIKKCTFKSLPMQISHFYTMIPWRSNATEECAPNLKTHSSTYFVTIFTLSRLLDPLASQV